jgi:two-component system, NarL family, nitrate/nitrite response regulator NarL
MMVAICDKAALFREALAAVVRSRGHQVVCCVGVLADAVRAMERCRADVMLLDASLADGDSLAQLRGGAQHGSAVRVLLLAASRENRTAAAALESGLVEGVFDHAVALGTLERALTSQRGPRLRRTVAQPAGVDALLTGREYEVISLMLAGRSTDTIASALGVSRSTVHSHVQGILRKLGARNRVEAVNIYLGDRSRKPHGVPWP